MSVRTRFAPSPTGRLHFGNLRTAVLCWLYAQAHQGAFVLRLDDTDSARSNAAYAEHIKDDLNWLGLHWDDMLIQSQRLPHYEAAFQRLMDSGRVYACYETPEELNAQRAAQRARGRPPIYNRAALALDEPQRKALEAQGRRAHWRFRLSGKSAQWVDMIRGKQQIATANMSDPVLRRADGGFLYTLPSVVDDIDGRISHIIRGEDHVTNTAVQLELFACLGTTTPQFAHHPLLVDAEGAALSKRSGALDLDEYKAAGYEPLALAALLAHMGTALAPDTTSLADLAARFRLDGLGRSALRFASDDLDRINARLTQNLSYDLVAARLKALKADGGEAFWLAIRSNVIRVSDAVPFYKILTDQCTPQRAPEDEDFLAQASVLLPAGDLTDASWHIWTQALSKQTGRNGKALFLPLRLALTGLDHGPEMRVLLPLIGRARAKARLLEKT